MARPADDAITRYLNNRLAAQQPKPPSAKQAEAAGQRRGEAANMYYAQRGHLIASLGPQTTSKVKVDENGNPVFGGGDTAGGKPPDWQQYLSMFGLPPDVLKEVNAIFQRTPDVSQATTLAVGYVRGTDWYKTAYPGIGEAIAKGLVRDERDYRAKMNEFDQVYRQWTNQGITAEQYAQHLQQGVDAGTVERQFAGGAIADASQNDWQHLAGAFGSGRLDQTQIRTLGNQAAGLSSPGGIALQKMIQDASMKLSRVFQGVLATGPMGGLERAQGRQTLPDIGR